MLPCNSSDSSDWLKICLYKYGACPSIKSCMKQYLIFNCNYHSMKCRNKQSCQVQPWSLFPIREQAANSRFPFCRKLPQRYFWISNWSLMIPLDKLSRSEIEAYEIPYTSSGIYNTKSPALLWCKLHRSTSSQLGTKLIFRKYLSCLVANLSTSIKPRLSTSTQIMSKWFSFFCFLHF